MIETSPLSPEAAAILRFYADAGVVTVEGDEVGALLSMEEASRSAARAPQKAKPSVTAEAPPSAAPAKAGAIAEAEALAAGANDLPALIAAIEGFHGCPLREGARSTVIHDGIIGADLLVMGEAPGRDEDSAGKPFVGRAGQLLDRMLAAIGHSRRPDGDERAALITNVVFWRPPGNRNPTKSEIAVCLPFARRFLELAKPKVVLTTGNVPTSAFFPEATSITRARGHWKTITTPGGDIPAMPVFHPAFLLRQPASKRFAWKDLLAVQAKLNETLS